LRLLGGDVRTANDGPSGLKEAVDFRPGIAFLDIGMPGMSGHELARRIRERPELRGMVLVALTGWGQAEDQERSRAAGFDHHLTKPAGPDALKQLLDSLDRDAVPA
jgi:CheY-like chemotaxis protein